MSLSETEAIENIEINLKANVKLCWQSVFFHVTKK